MASRPSARTTHFALHCLALPPVRAPVPASAEVSHSPARALFPVNGLWMGAVVPKRWAKRAVTRNMIKRQVLQLTLPKALCNASMALVVRLRTGFDVKQFKSASSPALKAQVRMELTQLFASLALPMQAVSNANASAAGLAA